MFDPKTPALADAKFGTLLAVFNRGELISLTKVTKVNKTSVTVTNGTRYRISDGYLIGSGSWSMMRAAIATDEDMTRARCQQLQAQLAKVKVTPDNMELVAQLIAQEKKNEIPQETSGN